jgi:hypothetical protein
MAKAKQNKKHHWKLRKTNTRQTSSREGMQAVWQLISLGTRSPVRGHTGRALKHKTSSPFCGSTMGSDQLCFLAHSRSWEDRHLGQAMEALA